MLTIYSAAMMPSTMAQKKHEITPRLMKMIEATNCKRHGQIRNYKTRADSVIIITSIHGYVFVLYMPLSLFPLFSVDNFKVEMWTGVIKEMYSL